MMKFKSILFSVFFAASVWNGHAAFLCGAPQTRTQPDGNTLHCYASGDEFFNDLHDKAGYTIIKNPVTGYYVYAVQEGDDIVASDHIAGVADPAKSGLTPGTLISSQKWNNQRELRFRNLQKLEKIKKQTKPLTSPPTVKTSGTPNFSNIMVFIRFKGDPEFTIPLENISQMFNDNTPGANSLLNYFQGASYN